ncbi:MAG: nucleotidyltransferase [Erysipelotrichaceae bacterium]|nr:nucleotidyltransferase [Erysipelotrichaceae bacterium]
MKAAGIVVEYNPFHNGHLYHIEKTREITGCDVLIAVMSGHFVQRGEPALVDKWQRTEAALKHGVDLVIELPYLWCTQSAQQFADGAVALLKLAQVETMVFGSESNNLSELQEIADLSTKADYLKEILATGEGFPKAYGLWTQAMEPNDILAVAYLKALKDSQIVPMTIQRTTHYHDEELSEIASATAIRKAVLQQKDTSKATPMELKEPFVTLKQFYPYLRMLLCSLSSDYLNSLFLFSEGIENHLRENAAKYDTFEEFMNHSITKRYTRARIQRTLCQLINQITKKEAKDLAPLTSLRVLGFNDKGQKWLKHLRECEVDVASSFAQMPASLRKMELKATTMYASFMTSAQRTELIKREIAHPIRIQ